MLRATPHHHVLVTTDLKDVFRDAGEVVYADVMKNDDGRSKGCGIVEFATPEQAAYGEHLLLTPHPIPMPPLSSS